MPKRAYLGTQSRAMWAIPWTHTGYSSMRQVLLDAAAAADLDGADALLASDQLHDEVWSEVESAYQAGVSGVPHFKIDGGGPGRELSGGQPPEAFLRILRSLP